MFIFYTAQVNMNPVRRHRQPEPEFPWQGKNALEGLGQAKDHLIQRAVMADDPGDSGKKSDSKEPENQQVGVHRRSNGLVIVQVVTGAKYHF